MTQTLTANVLAMSELKDRFDLERNDDPSFFGEWQQGLPNLSDGERDRLDAIKSDFCSLQDEPLNEEVVKMAMLAPLLSLAGFFRHPLYPRAEVEVELAVEAEDSVIRGRLDVLVVYQQFWVMAIEAKRRLLTLDAALPQALFYLLNSPQQQEASYGFITNGNHFQFLKCVGNQYALSDEFTTKRRVNELYIVMQIIKRLGGLVIEQADQAVA